MTDQGALQVLLAAVTAGTLLAGFLSTRLHQRVDRIISRISDISAMLQERAEEGRPVSRAELRDIVAPLSSPLGRDRVTAWTTAGISTMFSLGLLVLLYTLLAPGSHPVLATIMIMFVFFVVVLVSLLDSGAIAHLISKQEDRVLVRYFTRIDIGVGNEKDTGTTRVLRGMYRWFTTLPRRFKRAKGRLTHLFTRRHESPEVEPAKTHTLKATRRADRVTATDKQLRLDDEDTWRMLERECTEAFLSQPALMSACVGALISRKVADQGHDSELPILVAPLVEFFNRDPSTSPGSRRLWLTAGYALALVPQVHAKNLPIDVRPLPVLKWATRLLRGGTHHLDGDPMTLTIVALRLALELCSDGTWTFEQTPRDRLRQEEHKTKCIKLLKKVLKELSGMRAEASSHGTQRSLVPVDTAAAKTARAILAIATSGRHLPLTDFGDALSAVGEHSSSDWLHRADGLVFHEWLRRPIVAQVVIDSLHLRRCNDTIDWRELVRGSLISDDTEERIAGHSMNALILLLLLYNCSTSYEPAQLWIDDLVDEPDPAWWPWSLWLATETPEAVTRLVHADRGAYPTETEEQRAIHGAFDRLPLGRWVNWFNTANLPATWVWFAATDRAVSHWHPPLEWQACWQPDPSLTFEFRYFNGARWTEHVITRGKSLLDPLQPREGTKQWLPDPSGRHGERFFDGQAWTEHVCDGDAILDQHRYGTDPDAAIVGTSLVASEQPPINAPRWGIDPSHRHLLRYHDGQQWTRRYVNNPVPDPHSPMGPFVIAVDDDDEWPTIEEALSTS